MKLALLVAGALLVSCASSDDLTDRRYLGCEPGQDVSIAAGLDTGFLDDDGSEDHFNVLVEVSNNSHEDITVKTIGVDQTADDFTTYVIDRGYAEYDLVVAPGKDHTFEVPVRGRARRSSTGTLRAPQAIDLRVVVLLADGDQYRCSFVVGASR